MTKHLITYDLCAPGRNYDDLIAAIKAYGAHAKICESCWAIKSNSTDIQIRDNLMGHIDSSDRLFVCAIDDNKWASYGLRDKVNDWLNS